MCVRVRIPFLWRKGSFCVRIGWSPHDMLIIFNSVGFDYWDHMLVAVRKKGGAAVLVYFAFLSFLMFTLADLQTQDTVPYESH